MAKPFAPSAVLPLDDRLHAVFLRQMTIPGLPRCFLPLDVGLLCEVPQIAEKRTVIVPHVHVQWQ